MICRDVDLPDADGGVSALLESFLAEHRCIPPGAARLDAAHHLPEGLRRLVQRTSGTEDWRAWADARGSIGFVRVKLSSTFTRRLSRPTLHVFFHDLNGEIHESGTWVRRPDARWERCQMPLARAGRRAGGRGG